MTILFCRGRNMLSILILSFILTGSYAGNLTLSNDKEVTTLLGCKDNQYQCPNKRCIPRNWLCDGENDCGNGEDEDVNACSAQKCTEEQYKCKNPSASLCDNSTVINKVHNTLKTTARCLDRSQLCDGIKDCPLGDDESNCSNITCPLGRFQCQSHTNVSSCIPESWRCDGRRDCADGSDESNCDRCDKKDGNCPRFCKDNFYECPRDRLCISKKFICDGTNDCSDGSDEINCKCNKDTHFCCDSNGDFSRVLEKSFVCDGVKHCVDGSDEVNCSLIAKDGFSNVTVECSAKEFRCHDKQQCIPKENYCNEEVDCRDGSDEAFCKDSWYRHTSTRPCNTLYNYKCEESYGTVCVFYDRVCNLDNCRNVDCSKENNFCEPGSVGCTCKKKGSGNRLEGNGTLCYCDEGFVLKNGVCEDVNECLTPDNVCEQICVNTIGSFTCECHHGYIPYISNLDYNRGFYYLETTPKDKKRNCRFVDSRYLLLISDDRQIRKYNIETSEYNTLLTGLSSIGAMDYWFNQNMVVWTDMEQKILKSCRLNGSFFDENEMNCSDESSNVLVEGDVQIFGGIALDWVHGLVFYIDTGLKQINVVDIETRQRSTVISHGLHSPTSLAVDPYTGMIFWIDTKLCAVQRAAYNGNNVTVFVNGKRFSDLNALTLDIYRRRVHLLDSVGYISIRNFDYDGNRLPTQSHLFHNTQCKALASIDNDAYLVEKKGIYKNSGKKVMNTPEKFTSLRIYHREAQPEFPNKCLNNMCKYYQICMPKLRILNNSIDENNTGVPYVCINSSNVQPTEDVDVTTPEDLKNEDGFSYVVIVVIALLAVITIVIGVLAYYLVKTRRNVVSHEKYKLPTFSDLLTNDVNTLINNTHHLE